MSSAYSVQPPVTTAARSLSISTVATPSKHPEQEAQQSVQHGISYEGRLSLLRSSDPSAPTSTMEFDQAVVLRRIKAECDSMLDFHHAMGKSVDNFMGVDMSSLPALYAGVESPGSSSSNGGGLVSKTPDGYPATPVRSQQIALSGTAADVRQNNDSGISPGSTGAAGSTNSGDDLVQKRRHDSEMSGEDATGPGSVNSPGFSLSPMGQDDDDDLMDDDEEDDDLLDAEEGGNSRGAGSDVVGDALSRIERALLTQQPTPGEPGSNGGVPVYQCTMCSYSATSRFHFQAHLNSHFDVKCSHCDFTARTEGKLRAHMRNAHSDVIGFDDDNTMKVSRASGSSKLKSHKCKHPDCGFVAVSKMDFWEHTRSHIKAEKLLTCPHCPFVTEYKHHLEYHTRNHLNSKPFKCPKCSYSCVNKSMLNSHMKSHSNVYQFRCKDCAYATKYQHSLKLHLRKYGHTCTVNLNLEGDDADAAVVVAAGKTKGRRGPKKPRATKAQKQQQQTIVDSPVVSAPTGFLPPNAASAAMAHPFNFPIYAGHPLLSAEHSKKQPIIQEPFKCASCDFITVNKEHFGQHLLAHAAADQHQRELANLFSASVDHMMGSSTPQETVNRSQHQQQMTPLKGTSTPHHQVKDYLSRMLANPTLLFTSPVQQPAKSRTPSPVERPIKPNHTPLDLSREKDDPLPAKHHRRKGQAFKLERSTQAQSHSATPSPSSTHHDDDEEPATPTSPPLTTAVESPKPVVVQQQQQQPSETEKKGRNVPSSEWGGAYQCAYCDIAFKDVVMYTMHMGYHGYADPFTCNMCGHSTNDKLAFFLHIARSSHS